MGELLVALNRVLLDVLSRCICVLCRSEAPSELLHVPVHAGEGNYVFEAFQTAHDERTVGPGAGIGDLFLVSKEKIQSTRKLRLT